MVKRDKIRWRAAAAMLVLVLWGSAVYYGKAVEQTKEQVWLRYTEEEPVDAGVLKALIAQEREKSPEGMPEVSAWNVEYFVEVTNPSLFRKQKAACISVLGDKFPAAGAGLSAGTYGFASDKNGCLISRSMAASLFGSLNVIGREVTCKNQNWMIRGILNHDDPIIVLPSQEEEAYRFLSFGYRDGDQIARKTEDLMFRYGLSRQYTLIDGSFFASAARLFWYLPAWCLWFVLFFHFRRWSGPWWMRFVICFVWMAGIIIGIKLSIRFSADFIPNKWSDFSFWTMKYEEVKQSIRELNRITPSYQDLLLKKSMIRCIVSSFFASAGVIVLGQPKS